MWDFHATDFPEAVWELVDNFIMVNNVSGGAFGNVDTDADGAEVEVGFAFGFARW